LLAPALFAASIYMTLSRLITSLNATHLSPIPIKHLTKAFLLGDWLSFIIQGNSASLTFRPKTQKIGEVLIVIGLFVQILSFTLFFVTAIIWHKRINKNPTSKSLEQDEDGKNNWRTTMKMMYIVSALILGRSIFRVIEYLMGYEGYLFVNEWTLYVFDAVPMLVAGGVFWWWWPGWIEVVKEEGEVIELKERRWWLLGMRM
jgi:hypothetical protein